MALRANIAPDEAEPAGFGGPKVKGDNKVWRDFHPSDQDPSLGTPDFHPSDQDPSLGTPDFRRNPGPQTRDLCVFGWKPKGRGQFFRFRCRSSLTDTRYASLLSSRTRKNWLLSPPSQ
jgi:hypothetical protein